MKSKTFALLLLLAIALFVCWQLVAAYALWHSAQNVTVGSDRTSVLQNMPIPLQERLKASPADLWQQRVLTGGVRVTIIYSDFGCYERRPKSLESDCQVISINKDLYTLWGNNWFLAYSSHVQ